MKTKFAVLLAVSLMAGALCKLTLGLSAEQSLIMSVFLMSIMGTLLFWEFRLSFVFIGSGFLFLIHAMNMENFIVSASLDVILFLIGMMIIVAMMKEAGFFYWLITVVLRVKNINARKLFIILMLISALLSAMMDEVSSIIIMVTVVFEISDFLEVNPVPLMLSSILATNIGSASTVLGNPIGVLIAARGGLTFEDFLVTAFPIAVIALLATVFIVLRWFRRQIAEIDGHIKEMQANEILLKLISVPMDRHLKSALCVFAGMMVFIVLHRRLELVLGLEENTILLIIPMMTAGIIMAWKQHKAREYVERGIEWWTLLFFMLLFAQAGTLRHTGATDVFARIFADFAHNNAAGLLGFTLWSSSIGSSVLDNVIVVVTYIPVIKSFFALGYGTETLWWALLLGGCFGGNITLIGSTANIVAIGLLEKEKNIRIRFRDWFGIGLTVGLVTTGLAWAFLFFGIFG